MVSCRVYLFTYNRHDLLKRAINSLINQTFTNWICELHNDFEGDSFPEKYLLSIKDERFIIKNHTTNLGPTASFNLAYTECQEKYASILEDDNWWEPRFLEEMISLMEKNEKIDIAWANMKIWREGNNNSWTDTGLTTWPIGNDIKKFYWPNLRQSLGSLHSNGAMIYRGRKAKNYIIPENALFNTVEHIRERTFEYPIYLHTNTLANFSQTISSAQSDDSYKWIGTQTMLLSSFLLNQKDLSKSFKELLNYYRHSSPKSINTFILANVFYLKTASLLKYISLKEWISVFSWLAVNVNQLKKISRYLKTQKNTWKFLMENTAKRNTEIKK